MHYRLPENIVIMDKHRINSKGYHPATVEEMDKCIGCAFCARICPDVVIEVENRNCKGMEVSRYGKSIDER